jgi:hypothetical protein
MHSVSHDVLGHLLQARGLQGLFIYFILFFILFFHEHLLQARGLQGLARLNLGHRDVDVREAQV